MGTRRGRRNPDSQTAQTARRAKKSVEVSQKSKIEPNDNKPRTPKAKKVAELLAGPTTPIDSQNMPRTANALGGSVIKPPAKVRASTGQQAILFPEGARDLTVTTGKEAEFIKKRRAQSDAELAEQRASESAALTSHISAKMEEDKASEERAAELLRKYPNRVANPVRASSDEPRLATWENVPPVNRGIRRLHAAIFTCATCKLPSSHSGGIYINNEPACTVCTDQGKLGITPHQS